METIETIELQEKELIFASDILPGMTVVAYGTSEPLIAVKEVRDVVKKPLQVEIVSDTISYYVSFDARYFVL